MKRHPLSLYWPILASCALWAWPMVIIKLLQDQGFDLHTLNFFRYLASSVVLQALAWKYQPDAMLECFRKPLRFLVPALLTASFQVVWVMGVFKSMPAAGALVTRSTVLWGLILSFVIFPDERGMMRSPAFLLGAAGSLAGLAGIILSRAGAAQGDYSIGLVYLAISAFLWASYGISIKMLLSDVPALTAFATTASVVCAMLLAPGLIAGDLAHIARVPFGWALLLLVSGPIFLGCTQALMFESIRRVGVAATNVVTLSIPLVTAVSSYFVLGEELTAAQWCFGALLIGSLAAIMLGSKAPAEIIAAPPAPPPPRRSPDVPASGPG